MGELLLRSSPFLLILSFSLSFLPRSQRRIGEIFRLRFDFVDF